MCAEWTDRFESILRGHLRRLEPDVVLDPQRPLAEVGLNSMEVVRLLVDLEDSLGVTFPDELIEPRTFATAASLWQVVSTLESPR